jgi:hypothetical protein
MTNRRRLGSSTQRGGAILLAVGVLGILISPHSILSWLFLAAGLLMTGILGWDWWTVRRKLPRNPSRHP